MKPAPPDAPTAYVVDDDPDMRHSLNILIPAMGFPCCTFRSAAEFYDFYRVEFRGCLILDVKMPREGGLEFYERLLRDGKRLPAIFITAHANVTTAVAAMKTGAIEFLEKPFDSGTLRDRMQKAFALDDSWRAQDAAFEQLRDRLAQLTERERETLDLLMTGESNKTIAARLFISERAVELRRAGMLRKLGLNSTAELLDLAITHRVLSEVRRAATRRHIFP